MNRRDARACFLMAQAGATQFRTYAQKLLNESAVPSEDIENALVMLDEAVEILQEAREFFEGNPLLGEYRSEWEMT